MSNSEITLSRFEQRGGAVSALIRSFREDRLDRAVLLCGVKGTGKATLAGLLAQGLLCVSPGERPCGVCRSCLRVGRGTHPDCLTVRPAPKDKTIKVDAQVRPLLAALSRHPLEGDRRAVIVPRAETMTEASQNALLKTLEETGQGTWFILTTDNETGVLSTIRSRCRIVRMPPFSRETIEKTLTAEGVPERRAETAAALSEGSLTAARELSAEGGLLDSLGDLAEDFLTVKGPAGYPELALKAKNIKDQADSLIDLCEQYMRLVTRNKAAGLPLPRWAEPVYQRADLTRCAGVLRHIQRARQMRRSNVSAAAVLEGLAQRISEETETW